MPSNKATLIRAAKDPNAEKIFGVKVQDLLKGGVETLGKAGQSFENLGKTVTKTSQITYSKVYKNYNKGIITSNVEGITGSIDGLGASLEKNLDKFSQQIDANLQPFSEFVGSTLGTLTGIIQDPLGPNGLGNVATRLINSVSPGLGEKINGLNQSLHLEVLGRLPGQVMSGIDHILTGIRDLLAVPLSILSEIYYGYQAIMKSISKLVNSVIDGFFQLILNFIDSIIPIKSIMGLLESISSLAGQIGGLAGAFNISAITNVTSMITGFTSQFTSILNNPLDSLTSLLPADISGFISDIRDPQALIEGLLPAQVTGFIDGLANPKNLIKQFLPADLQSGFDKIADMTGFGYTGNMGYGFKDALGGPQKTVLQSIMSNFQTQIGALGPVLAGQPDEVQGYEAKLAAGHNVAGYNETRRVNRNQYQPSTQGGGSGGGESAYGYTERNGLVNGPGISETRNPDGSITRTVNGVTETTPAPEPRT